MHAMINRNNNNSTHEGTNQMPSMPIHLIPPSPGFFHMPPTGEYNHTVVMVTKLCSSWEQKVVSYKLFRSIQTP